MWPNCIYFSIAFPPRLPVRTTPELAQTPTNPLSQSYPDGFELIGYDQLLRDNPSSLELVLHWRSLAYAHEDYLTEISLLDAQGQVVLQTVAYSAHGRYPTRAWDPGDIVRDTIMLPLSGVPTGRYDVQLRLLGWEAPLAADEQEAIILTEVDILASTQASGGGVALAQAGSSALNIELWQGPEPVDHLATYRYLADIPIVVGGHPPGTEVRLSLVGPDDARQSPIVSASQLHTFIVGPDWPSGNYALVSEIWQDQSLLEATRLDNLLMVANRAIPFAQPDMPHRIEANFDNKVMLLGYDLESWRVNAKDGISLSLYWQALQRMRESYVMFVRLLDQDQQAVAGYDRLPQEIYSTILWVPDEVIFDGFVLPVADDVPDGIYHLVLGLYQENDPQAVSLPLIHEGQPTNVSSINLGSVKIGQAPNDLLVTDFAPQVPLNEILGHETSRCPTGI